MNRRKLLRASLAGASLLSAGHSFQAIAEATSPSPGKRKFTIDLTPGAIGVKAKPDELIDLAAASGFESIQPNASFLASLDATKRKEFTDALRAKGLTWGAAGMPVDFRKDEASFRSGLKDLPELAAALQDAGVTRIGTWLMPFHAELTYLANFRQHVDRLGQVTTILADHGLRFGLEYVGTKTLWTKGPFPFLHSMAETKELIAEIDQPTLGFILDSWHWFTAGETAGDILTLTNSDIIACDLNDAPTEIPADELIDSSRELPAATGVIDTAPFLKALVALGYDGPVRAEPFNQPLRDLDDEPAAMATATAIRKAISEAGL
jgi:sugar phosphate isomerase/epimerase